MTEYDSYAFDTTSQPLMTWLTARLKYNRRDKIDALARRMLADRRLPRSGSLGMYRLQLASKNYSADDRVVFETIWIEMRTEESEYPS